MDLFDWKPPPPKRKGMGGHHAATPDTTTWLTPPEIIAALGGPQAFDLDPCTIKDSPIPTAREVYHLPTNGLAQPWRGRVWLNPPYTTDEVGRWLRRLADHGDGTALIFARTETAAFHGQVWERASGLLFLAGRLHFHYADGRRAKANAGAPSVLCAYGDDDLDRLAASELQGAFVPLRFARFTMVAALDSTWREIVLGYVRRERGPVSVSDLYRALAKHPKAKSNPNWRAKVRQTLQRAGARNVGPGLWEAPSHAAV